MARTDPAEPRVSAASAFLWMTLYLALTNIGIIGLSHLGMPQRSGAAMFGVWILQLILIFGLAGWFNRRLGGRGWLPILVIAFAILALIYGLLLGHIPRVFLVRESPLVTVSEAAQPSTAENDVFFFSDARVDLDHVYRRKLRNRGGSVTYLVAPLVPIERRSGDPVTAWVAATGLTPEIPASWREKLRGGYRVGLDSLYEEIVEEHVRAGPLRSSPGAPILVWSGDPKGDFRTAGFLELSLFLAIDAVGLVTVLLSGRGKAGA